MRASGYKRNDDEWYIEPRWLVDALLEVELIEGEIWEPSCGSGNIVSALRDRGQSVFASDIVQRGAADMVFDFFQAPDHMHADVIISNPPFNVLREYVEHATGRAGKVIVCGRLAFLEGQSRREWFKTSGLKRVWVSSRRASMPPGGSETPANGGSIAYAWFVFHRHYQGEPTVGWI